jgi:hypothetical protein
MKAPKRLTAIITVLFLSGVYLSAQSIAIDDFTAVQEDIRPLMTGATDVFRSAMAQNTLAEITANREDAAWVITGTVTRFGTVKAPDTKNGGNFSGSVNVAIQLFNFLAPALQTGHIGSQNNARPNPESEPHVVVSARLTDLKTGRIVAAASVSTVTWEDYLAKTADLARELGARLPFPETVFAGLWDAVIEHGGYEDTYRINFRSGGQCNITVTSVDPSGKVNSHSGEGRYTWNDEILNINARFAETAVTHVRSINWRALALLAADRRSFTMTIPVSPAVGALRVGARFWKESR